MWFRSHPGCQRPTIRDESLTLGDSRLVACSRSPRFGYQRGDFPVAEALSDRTIAWPFHGLMSARQLGEAVSASRKLL